MASLPRSHARNVSVPGAIAALMAAATCAYMLLVLAPGLGLHLGRISIFVPSFVAMLVIACAAGAVTRGFAQRAVFLGMAAAGFGALGYLWIWIRLFIPQAGFQLLIAAALATIALAGAIMTSRSRFSATVSAAIGVCIALIILAVGLGLSIAPVCGLTGSSFHIDSWHSPWSAAHVCGDGRLSFDFWP